jgi:hypothetical protein
VLLLLDYSEELEVLSQLPSITWLSLAEEELLQVPPMAVAELVDIELQHHLELVHHLQ